RRDRTGSRTRAGGGILRARVVEDGVRGGEKTVRERDPRPVHDRDDLAEGPCGHDRTVRLDAFHEEAVRGGTGTPRGTSEAFGVNGGLMAAASLLAACCALSAGEGQTDVALPKDTDV